MVLFYYATPSTFFEKKVNEKSSDIFSIVTHIDSVRMLASFHSTSDITRTRVPHSRPTRLQVVSRLLLLDVAEAEKKPVS